MPAREALSVPSLSFMNNPSGGRFGFLAAADGVGALPGAPGEEPREQEAELAEHEDREPGGPALGEAVRVEADAELVHAEPGPAHDDVAEDAQQGQAALADHAAPAGVEDER